MQEGLHPGGAQTGAVVQHDAHQRRRARQRGAAGVTRGVGRQHHRQRRVGCQQGQPGVAHAGAAVQAQGLEAGQAQEVGQVGVAQCGASP